MRFLRRLACRAVWTATGGRARARCTSTGRCASRWCSSDDLPRSEPGGGGRKDGRAWTEQYPPAPAAADLQLTGRYPILVAGTGAGRQRGRRLRGAPPLAAARRPAVGRPPRRGRDRALRRAAARPQVGRGLRARPRRPRRGPPHLQAAAALAGRPRRRPPDRPRSDRRVAGPGRERLGDPPGRPGVTGRRAARRALAGRAGARPTPSPARRWAACGRARGLTEPAVAVRTAAALGPQDTLVVASSMPVRDLETFAVTGARVFANRGANGIDGTVATALGVAAATSGRTVLLIGDVAVLLRRRRAARRPAARGRRPHDRPDQQRRRRHLPLPPRGEPGGLRGARRHPARDRLRQAGRPRRLRPPPSRDARGLRPGARRARPRHHRGAHRPAGQRAAAPQRLGRRRAGHRAPPSLAGRWTTPATRSADNKKEHIFDGIVVSTDGGDVFVDAPEVQRIYERRVDLTVDAGHTFEPYKRSLFRLR